MTYDELKTNIANFLNRSDLTSQLDFFIDATEAEFNRRLRVKDMIKRATATADAQYISLPTDWLEAINVQIDSNEFTPLFQQSIESLDVYRKSINNVGNQPVYYALVDNTIELAPTPDTSYTLQLTYYGTIDALSSSNTTNFISTGYPDAYLYGALKHASIYLMEDDRVALFTQQFEKALEEMRLEQEKAEFGKGSLIQRRRTYGKAGKNINYWSNN
jgi:Sec7-like guanine-nucleotide exchange factor